MNHNIKKDYVPTQREPFDYTEWKQNHWKDKTVKEIHKEAADFRKQKRATTKKKVVK